MLGCASGDLDVPFVMHDTELGEAGSASSFNPFAVDYVTKDQSFSTSFIVWQAQAPCEIAPEHAECA